MNLRDEFVNQHARRRVAVIEGEMREMAAAKLYGWRLVVIDAHDGTLRFNLMRLPASVALPQAKRRLIVYEMDAETAAVPCTHARPYRVTRRLLDR